MRTTLTTIDEIWGAAMPRFTPQQQQASIVLLRELSKGLPVSVSRFGEMLDVPTGEHVRLTISPERIEASEPESIVLSMTRADTVDFTSATRVIATACHYIFFFFAGRASGERWVAAHPQTTLLSLEEAFTLARRQNERLFGEELARRVNA